MSADLDSPVQIQMAVSLFRSPLGREYHGNARIKGAKTTGRRRVFVQTETGCVLGMELDRSDSAHMVKRRLQIALNVPIEESSLTFGDMVLNNDLSAIRNDSPLLLTRNLLHRSSSTPCLSPTGRDIQQKDQSGPVEILGHSSRFVRAKHLVDEVVKAMKTGVDPIPVHGGLGGAYYFRNSRGESVAIVKPTDEEPFAPNNPKGFVGKALGQPGLKRSVRVGETGFREVAAYLLDYGHFANVPATALVKITHSIFNVNDGVSEHNKIQRKKKLFSKIASFQQFIAHDFDASDHGTSSFPVSAVHRIGILDIRIFNTDRHAGNLLVRKLNSDDGTRFSEVELIPIDHGLCLPEDLEDPYFEWIHWPQASIPFSEDELEYIEKLDPHEDADMLKNELPMIREACLRTPLSKLEEEEEEEEEESEEETDVPSASKLSLKMLSLGNNSGISKLKSQKTKVESGGYLAVNSSSGHRSANEPLAAGASFVKLGDMTEEQWELFLEIFKDLLYPAFAKRKSVSTGQRQRQRLGTSCQF
ncbi:putative 1-phosphatidylinositol 4-kinase [Helianthus annuus]|nr:putative 1-phosphatidylinositol 4-kinase [Helianthus annuus]